MSDLSPDDRALIDAARDGGAPTSADRARVQRRLAAQLGAAAVGLTATTTATSAAASGWLAGTSAVTKVVIALGVVGSVGAGATVVYNSSHAARRAAVTQTATATATASASATAPSTPTPPAFAPPPLASPSPQPEPAPPVASLASAPLPSPPPPPRHATPAPAGASAGSTLDEELALLAQADAALRRGDATAALAQLDEHARRFPKSSVQEERQVEHVLALCAAGRVSEARNESDAFVRAHPASPYVARLRASCAFR